MPDFLSSLLLVAVAQIPLLLKLWLDHKNTISGFKQELYKRQIDLYLKLSAELIEVHQNSEVIIELLDEGSLPQIKDGPNSLDIAGTYQKNNQKLMDTIKEAELLLPAELCVDLPNYVTCSTRLWVKGFAPMVSSQKSLSSSEIWEEQENLYNTITNRMRIVCGTDMLSKSTINQFLSSTDKKTSFVLRKLSR